MHTTKHTIRRDLAMSFVVAGALLVTLVQLPFARSSLEARIIELRPTTASWGTITEMELGSGATIPAGRHVFFQVPVSVQTIDREVLLGQRGKKIRYWGYCFPNKDDPENPPQSAGFPGKIFLSEAERAWRKALADRQNIFSPFQRPSIAPLPVRTESLIRHQLEIFRGGMTCYIMAAKELPIGIDEDGDGLNSQLEKEQRTDARRVDSDDDGLNDAAEVILGTDPLRRDSDGDGLIDGLEEININKTDPRQRDTDGDGLCDGLCHEFKVRRMCKDNKGTQCIDIPYGQIMGEDKNLNGKVDIGETDPRKAESLNDGIRDDVRFFMCLLDGKKDC